MSRFIKSFLSVSFALLISLTSFPQQKVTQLSTSWSKLNQESTLDYFSSPDQKYLGIVVSNNDSARVIITNPSFKIIYQFGIGRDVFEKFSGAFIRNDSIGVFMTAGNYIHSWVCEVKTGKLVEHKIPIKRTPERFISALSTGKKYLHILVKKNEPILVVHEFNGKDEYERTEYDLSDQALNTNLNDKDLNNTLTKSKFLRKVSDVAIIHDTEIQTPETCLHPTKLYIRRDSLFIISNKKERLIDMYILNLKNKTKTYRSIDFNDGSNIVLEDSSFYHNSFLEGNELYYMFGNRDSLTLSVNNFYSGKEIKRYTTLKTDSLIFNEISPDAAHTISSLMNEKPGEYKDYKTIKSFLYKASKGQALIYVYKNSSDINELTIGTIGKKFTLGAGILADVNSAGYSTFRPSAVIHKWKTVNKFNFALDPANGLVSPGDIVFNVFERTDQYKTGMKIKEDAEVVVAFHNSIYLIYLDKSAGLINIVKFKR